MKIKNKLQLVKDKMEDHKRAVYLSKINERESRENSRIEASINKFMQSEEYDFYQKLKSYKIDLNDLALVSVKTKDFNFGEIYEYAILSKDIKSFVLLRDFFEKKIQTIENCKIYNNMSIGEMLKHGDSYIELYNNTHWPCKLPDDIVTVLLDPYSDNYAHTHLAGRLRLPDSVERSLKYDGDSFVFNILLENVQTGMIGLEDIFEGNLKTYNNQVNYVMHKREMINKKQNDFQKLKAKYESRETFEF